MPGFIDSPSKIVITPYESKQGIVSLIFFSAMSAVILIPGILTYSLSPEHDFSLLIFFIIFSFLIDSVGVILYIHYPRATIIFDGEMNQAIIRESKKQDVIIPFSDLQPFFIFENVPKYKPYFFCLNDSFGKYSRLFSTTSHERTLRKSKSMIKLVCGSLMDTNGRLLKWNEID